MRQEILSAGQRPSLSCADSSQSGIAPSGTIMACRISSVSGPLWST